MHNALLINPYKEKFKQALKPFVEMLEYQKSIVSLRNWLTLVETLTERVIQNPDQYLGNDLPSKEIISEIVHGIFDEFVGMQTSTPEETYHSWRQY